MEARAVGVTGSYIRSLAAAGIRGSIDDYVQLRAMGVNARDARSGVSMQKLIKLKEGEFDPFDGNPPEPPNVDPDPDPDPNE